MFSNLFSLRRGSHLPSLQSLLLALCMVVALSGCVKNEFDVDISVAKGNARHYSLQYYASDPRQGWLVETAVIPVDGKANVHGITRNPTLVLIKGKPTDLPLVLYAERGDRLTLEGKSDNPVLWSAKGNKLTEKLSDWRLANERSLSTNNPQAINEAVARYVRENPKAPASTILLLVYYDRSENESEFRKLWESLRGDASERKWSDLVGRADISFTDNPFPAEIKSFLLNSIDNGVDTIRIGTGRPALLYFSRSDLISRTEDIRAIRRLAAARSDSSRRIIADICFDADSASRAWQSNRDSLRGVIRAWMPLGHADSIAVALRVNSLPTFVVYDAKGKLRYRGPDADRALSSLTP